MTRRMGIVLTLGVGLVVFLVSCTAPTIQPQPSPISEYQLAETGGSDERISALGDAGATIEPVEAVTQPFFAAPGQIIELNGSEVQVFECADAGALLAGSDLISPDGYDILTSMVTWVDQPNCLAQGRTTVLYLGSDQSTIDLLTDLLGEPSASGAPAAT